MTRRRGWFKDESPEDCDWTYETIVEHGFWRSVDSAPSPYAEHRNECEVNRIISGGYANDINICPDWTHRRSDGCMAARSDHLRCARPALRGVPFCDFHFGDAWQAMVAFVNHDRTEQAARVLRFERERSYAELAVTVAMVEDLRLQAAKQPERVYFFAADHAVKIGRSINPTQRVRSLGGTLAPEGVDVASGELLGTIPGGSRVEGSLHRQFRAHRLVGEWFTLEPIRVVVDSIIGEFAVASEQEFLRRQAPGVAELVEEVHAPSATERKQESLRAIREARRSA